MVGLSGLATKLAVLLVTMPTRLTNDQQFVLYRNLLKKTVGMRSVAVGSDVSDPTLARLHRIDHRVTRRSAPNARGAGSIEIGIGPETRRGLFVTADLTWWSEGENFDPKNLKWIELILSKRNGTWRVIAPVNHPVPASVLGKALSVLLIKGEKEPVFVDTPSPVLRILRKWGFLVQPDRDFKTENSYNVTGFLEVNGIRLSWVDKEQLVVYATTLFRRPAGDVSYLYSGPILVTLKSHVWHADRIEDLWAGE